MTDLPPQADERKFATLSDALIALLEPSLTAERRKSLFDELRTLAPQHGGDIGQTMPDGT